MLLALQELQREHVLELTTIELDGSRPVKVVQGARAIARWLSLTCQRRTTSSISIRCSSRYPIPSTLSLVADMVANGPSGGLMLDGDLLA